MPFVKRYYVGVFPELRIVGCLPLQLEKYHVYWKVNIQLSCDEPMVKNNIASGCGSFYILETLGAGFTLNLAVLILQAFIQSMGTMGEVSNDFRGPEEDQWMEQQSSARLFERSRIKVLAGKTSQTWLTFPRSL